MAKDYDAPRSNDELGEGDGLELPTGRSAVATLEEDEDLLAAETFDLPGGDLSNEELQIQVLPPQKDEFTCSSCFLVHHRSQLAAMNGDQPICTECADG